MEPKDTEHALEEKRAIFAGVIAKMDARLTEIEWKVLTSDNAERWSEAEEAVRLISTEADVALIDAGIPVIGETSDEYAASWIVHMQSVSADLH